MAALRPGNRNAIQTNKSVPRRDRDAGDAEALRRRIEELESGNALMREVVEVAEKKDPGADLRRLSNREKTLPAARLRARGLVVPYCGTLLRVVAQLSVTTS